MPILDPPTFDQLEYRREEVLLSVREYWLWKGVPHSVDDHPSVIVDDGRETQWHSHGMRHRPESVGPAWLKDYGRIQLYYSFDELHRERGPAMITPYEEKWYWCGDLHRADGPAVVRTDGRVEWHWRSNQYIMDDWAERSKVDPELFTMLKLQYG